MTPSAPRTPLDRTWPLAHVSTGDDDMLTRTSQPGGGTSGEGMAFGAAWARSFREALRKAAEGSEAASVAVRWVFWPGAWRESSASSISAGRIQPYLVESPIRVPRARAEFSPTRVYAPRGRSDCWSPSSRSGAPSECRRDIDRYAGSTGVTRHKRSYAIRTPRNALGVGHDGAFGPIVARTYRDWLCPLSMRRSGGVNRPD